MNKYRCSLCHEIHERDSEKQWIRSFCEAGGDFARLILIRKLPLATNKDHALVYLSKLLDNIDTLEGLKIGKAGLMQIRDALDIEILSYQRTLPGRPYGQGIADYISFKK